MDSFARSSSANHEELGIQFYPSSGLSQQLASMSYSAGKVIPAHTHNPVRREVTYTQEALFIRKYLSSTDRGKIDDKLS